MISSSIELFYQYEEKNHNFLNPTSLSFYLFDQHFYDIKQYMLFLCLNSLTISPSRLFLYYIQFLKNLYTLFHIFYNPMLAFIKKQNKFLYLQCNVNFAYRVITTKIYNNFFNSCSIICMFIFFT